MTMKRCFTLVEMLAVVAIIGILAGIALGVSGAVRSSSAKTKTQSTLKMLEMAFAQYKEKNDADYMIPGYDVEKAIGRPLLFAAVDDPLIDCLEDVVRKYDSSDNVIGIESIKGMNIQNVASGSKHYIVFLDGWNRPLVYLTPGVFNQNSFDLGSVGADGKFGANALTLPKFNKKLKFPADYLGNTALGDRNKKTDVYRKEFGNKDDITNFKNTTK